MTPPLLVIAVGNPSRGDDALGPLAAARLRERVECERVEILEAFQLAPEHALDLADRRRVLFVDASVSAPAPFTLGVVVAAPDGSATTHALSPAAVLDVARRIGVSAPPCAVLAIRGESFELGDALSAAARAHLDAALETLEAWIVAS